MRIIKFRGKRIDNGEWVYGMPYSFKIFVDFRKHESDCILMFNPEWDLEAQFNFLKDPVAFSHLKDSIWKVIPETVKQYTGQKDKHGQASYQDDIIRVEDYKNDGAMNYCVVEWLDSYGQFLLKRYKVITKDGRVFTGELADCGFRFEDVEMATLEIIGNLTDNPGLVESDTKSKKGSK